MHGLLALSAGAVASVLGDVRRYGLTGVESGAFVLGRVMDTADVVALAGTAGISRSSHRFVVSAQAIAALFDWAGEEDLLIRAQIHSHRSGAFLSESDIRYGFAVPGFITSVIPWFTSPPPDPGSWGWWRYEGEWCRIEPPRVESGTARIVLFDETGIHNV